MGIEIRSAAVEASALLTRPTSMTGRQVIGSSVSRSCVMHKKPPLLLCYGAGGGGGNGVVVVAVVVVEAFVVVVVVVMEAL